MATNTATTTKKTLAINSIIRPVPDDILAQQPPMKRNQQLGCRTLSGIQIDTRLLGNRFLDLVPLVGTGALGDKTGPLKCRDLDTDKYKFIVPKLLFLYGRWVFIQIMAPLATPNRVFVAVFDAEAHILLDCVELVCNNKYCVLNKITNNKIHPSGYIGFKICAHIDMDAMSKDIEYSSWFKEHGFPLDDDIGLFESHFRRFRGKDGSAPKIPKKKVNCRWDAQLFYINPDFKLRPIGLPRAALPYSIFDYGFINLNILEPTPGTHKLLVELSAYKCGNIIIYDHMPSGEITYPFLNTIIDTGKDGSLCKTNNRYFSTFQRFKDEKYDEDDLGGDEYNVCIKSYDIYEPTKVVHELTFIEKRYPDSSENYTLLADGRIMEPYFDKESKKTQLRYNMGCSGSDYIEITYVDGDSQCSELVIFNTGPPKSSGRSKLVGSVSDDGSETNEVGETGQIGYHLEVINNQGTYIVPGGDIYKWALLKSMSATNEIFRTQKRHYMLDSPSPKHIEYSLDGRFIAMVFNADESNYYYHSNLHGVLVFEKTPATKKWREIGYVNFPDHHRFFGANFQQTNDELGYVLKVSGGSKSGLDLIYLPDGLAAKYYSRLTKPGVLLGHNNLICRQMSKFLAYNRLTYQELGYGIARKSLGKNIKNKISGELAFINSMDPVIQVDNRKPINNSELEPDSDSESETELEKFDNHWGRHNSAWDMMM
jgi:hypothetical protein